MKQLFYILFCLLLIITLDTSAAPPREAYRIRTVVIDPGHGGHDAGCLGSSAREKHIALALSLKLGKFIEQNYPDVKVIFTRKTDVFIPLFERADIANKNHADLFICIHLNSGNKAAYGAETYVMGLHKSEDNLNVAKRENASVLLEDDYKTKYDGFDPNSPEANIIFSLYQNQFMHQSLSFAAKIQDQFEEYAGRNNRGVKQAGFLVLYKTAMPAVLIESGFLTHDMEEKYLDSDKGQTTIATSIFRAFKEYKIDMESPGGEKPVIPPSEITPKIKEEVKTNIDTIEAKQESKKDSVTLPKPVSPTPKPLENTTSLPVKEIKPQIEPAKPKEIEEPKAVIKPVKAINEAKDVFITVQIGATINPVKDNAIFLKNEGVRAVKCSDGYTRYVNGSFTNAEAARKKLAQLKSNGFKDAFITAFKGDQKITLLEAEQMLKTQ